MRMDFPFTFIRLPDTTNAGPASAECFTFEPAASGASGYARSAGYSIPIANASPARTLAEFIPPRRQKPAWNAIQKCFDCDRSLFLRILSAASVGARGSGYRPERGFRPAGAMAWRRQSRCSAPYGTRGPPDAQSRAGARRLPLKTQARHPVLRRPFSRRLSSRSTASPRTCARNRRRDATGCRPASRPARACRRAGSRSGRRCAMPRRDRA